LFFPDDTITMQDAVTMLMRALGYTSANGRNMAYPTGYLADANGLRVRLIGSHVETEDFDLLANGVAPTDTITRNDMGMLLYNFLLSERYGIDIARNPISGLQETQIIYTQVLRTFGIERIVGYVTGVRNYAINLNVIADRDGTLVGFEGNAFGQRDSNNIEISSLQLARPITTTKAALGLEEYNSYEGALEILGKKVDVFRHVNPNDRRPLPATLVVGKKHDAAVAANRAVFNSDRDRVEALTLGAAGTETKDFNQRNGFYRKDLSLISNFYRLETTGIITGGYTLEMSKLLADIESGDVTKPADPPASFTPEQRAAREALIEEFEEDKKAAEEARTAAEASEFLLGRLIVGQSANIINYNLTFVDNGFGLDGKEEFFYIFQPYEIGYVTTMNANGQFRMAGPTPSGDGSWMGNQDDGRPFDPVSRLTGWELRGVNGAAAITPVQGSAYMYTRSGTERRDITIYRTLDILRGGNETGVLFNGREQHLMRFEGTGLPVTFARANRDRAMLAWEAALPTSELGARYRVFGDAGENEVGYFARRIVDGPDAVAEARYTRFGVVLPPSGTFSELTLHGRQVLRHTVMNASTGVTETLFLAAPGDRTAAVKFEPGSIIAMRGRNDNQIFEATAIYTNYTGLNGGIGATSGAIGTGTTVIQPAAGLQTGNWGAIEDPEAGTNTQERVVSAISANAYNDAPFNAAAINNPLGNEVFNNTHTRITLGNPPLRYTASNGAAFALSDSTRYVVIGHDGTSPGLGSVVAGRVNSVDAVSRALGTAGVWNIITVGTGSSANAGRAEFVFVIANRTALNVASLVSVPRLGIVIPNRDLPAIERTTNDGATVMLGHDSWGTNWRVVDVYDYVTNTIVRAATTDLFRMGTLVTIFDSTISGLVGAPGTFAEIGRASPIGTGNHTDLLSGLTRGVVANAAGLNGPTAIPAGYSDNATRTYAGAINSISSDRISVGGREYTLTPGSRANYVMVRAHGETDVNNNPANWTDGNVTIGWKLDALPTRNDSRAFLVTEGARAVVTTTREGDVQMLTIIYFSRLAPTDNDERRFLRNDINWLRRPVVTATGPNVVNDPNAHTLALLNDNNWKIVPDVELSPNTGVGNVQLFGNTLLVRAIVPNEAGISRLDTVPITLSNSNRDIIAAIPLDGTFRVASGVISSITLDSGLVRTAMGNEIPAVYGNIPVSVTGAAVSSPTTIRGGRVTLTNANATNMITVAATAGNLTITNGNDAKLEIAVGYRGIITLPGASNGGNVTVTGLPTGFVRDSSDSGVISAADASGTTSLITINSDNYSTPGLIVYRSNATSGATELLRITAPARAATTAALVLNFLEP
jgi:hypothetical protein